jgi:hypothetical protein
MRLQFAKANRKLIELQRLTGKKVYSFSLLSGHNCPFAQDCQSFAVETTAGIRIKDGKKTKFRCFSASNEVLFHAVYKSRKANGEILKIAAKSIDDAANLILSQLPKDTGIVRIHIGGDFKTQAYFDTWLKVAQAKPKVLFYAYTKSIPFWVKRLNVIPKNYILTASIGGKADALALAHNLRTATVYVDSAQVPKKLPIDHDDSHAALPKFRKKNFALLEHGPQKGRKAQYGYGKMKAK